ncbi:MAG TPA: hypothetical protein ENJ09_02085, partial [Planctomycetes bacterium]|nr:hypothetical protein [Planctomycetota bacterium]
MIQTIRHLPIARVGLAAALALLAGGVAIGLGQSGAERTAAVAGTTPLPAVTALEPIELVDALPFVLDEPFPHFWRAEEPSVTSGYLLVLHADP